MANNSADTVSMMRSVWSRRRANSLRMASCLRAQPHLREVYLARRVGHVTVDVTGRQAEYRPPQRLDHDRRVLQNSLDLLHFHLPFRRIEGGLRLGQGRVELRAREVRLVPRGARAKGL